MNFAQNIIPYVCGITLLLYLGVKQSIPLYKYEESHSGIFLFDRRKLNFGVLKDEKQLEIEFVRYIASISVGCPERERLGNIRDGGWDVCMSGPYALKFPCLVYSFGIGDDWSFDDAVSRKYNCTVRAFDPSINTKNHTRRVKGSMVHFYNVGIAGTDKVVTRGNQTWMMRKFSTLYKALDPPHGSPAIQSVVDYLKLDVEGSEIGAVTAMFSDGILDNVKQIGLEVHTGAGLSIDRYLQQWKILEMLEAAGFRKWHFHANVQAQWLKSGLSGLSRTCCYELYYINTNFLNYDKDVTKVSYVPNGDIM